MPEIWQVTQAKFVGNWRVYDYDAPGETETMADFDRTSRDVVDDLTEGWQPRSLRPVPGHNGLFFASMPGVRAGGNVALIHRASDGEYDVVGGYVEETLWLARSVRGRGLAAELVLEAAERRGGELRPETYTSAGRKAHEAGHRLAVTRALRDGHRVPPHVLADYPDLGHAPEVSAAPGPR